MSSLPPPGYPPAGPYRVAAQRRWGRRRSIVGPLLLLALGVLFLMVQLGSISAWHALAWFGRWWPAILIFVGVARLIEWGVEQRTAAYSPYGSRSLGGGVVALLIVLVLGGLAAQGVVTGFGWANHDGNFNGLDRLLGNRADADNDMSAPLPAGAVLVIRDPRGDVTVNGTSPDAQVHVSVHSESYAWGEQENQRKLQQLMPVFSPAGRDLSLAVPSVEGGSADLTITVPAGTSVTITADHGDIALSGITGSSTLSANHGDVDASEIGGALQATINDDSASVTIKDVKGNVSITGHTGDMDISNVTGEVQLHGEFFGTTDLQHIAGKVDFETSRTHFSAARVDDEFSVAKDSVEATDLVGPVLLKTRDKNITIDRLQGALDLMNKNGSVEVTAAAPLGAISIQNVHGSVDLGVPASAGFAGTAQVHNGDIEDDFDLPVQEYGSDKKAHGTIGAGGPAVSVSTSDGDVTLRKSTVAPLPPAPPAPPAVPGSPGVAPKAPKVPAAPKSYSF